MNENKRTGKKGSKFGLKKMHFIMLAKQKYQLKIDGQNITKNIHNIEEKFIRDAKQR
jgi:hypothetical protein